MTNTHLAVPKKISGLTQLGHHASTMTNLVYFPMWGFDMFPFIYLTNTHLASTKCQLAFDKGLIKTGKTPCSAGAYILVVGYRPYTI